MARTEIYIEGRLVRNPWYSKESATFRNDKSTDFAYPTSKARPIGANRFPNNELVHKSTLLCARLEVSCLCGTNSPYNTSHAVVVKER
mmetsp:Transcript_19834/g.25345  ORF Transcript_19834/g.25345 Transcript_19834/m.25345 type:complete len:88 (+) Transcript_19834:116-379(+)